MTDKEILSQKLNTLKDDVETIDNYTDAILGDMEYQELDFVNINLDVSENSNIEVTGTSLVINTEEVE